ncbi:MAG: YdeI/OmpD-associated family protein [Steroidobacteraceae bacterium]
MQPTFFATAAAFRLWLERNAATTSELIVGFHKVDSGRPSMSWPDSVDEALCFGWIDGVRKRIDGQSYLIRFTPRKAGSIWSAVNVAKAESLLAQGRMQPAGLAAYQRRTEARTSVYSYEKGDDVQLTEEEQRRFRRDKAAWKYFESAPAGYRRTVLHRITAAKRPETRARRLEQLIAACAGGRRL